MHKSIEQEGCKEDTKKKDDAIMTRAMLHRPYMPQYLYHAEFPDFFVHLNLVVELGFVCYFLKTNHVVKRGWSATMVQTYVKDRKKRRILILCRLSLV